MLLHAITLDAAMTVSATRARLARYGLWLDPQEAEAKAWIEENAKLLKLTFGEAAGRLARKPRGFGAAIRRQWYANVLWYSRQAEDVLQACAKARSEDTLLNALNLHEPDNRKPLAPPAPGEVLQQEGVVLDGGTPLAVNMPEPSAARVPAQPRSGNFDLGQMRGPERGAPAPERGTPTPTDVRAWPRLDAPTYMPARVEFDVIVGLAKTQQARVAGGLLTFAVPAGARTIDVTVEMIADGLDALDGWTRLMHVDVGDPTSAEVRFRLRGRDPAGPEPVHLTTLEVRYVLDGTVCGTASRPLVIGQASALALSEPSGHGTPWLAQPATWSPVNMQRDKQVADLTIEIVKPDRNAANGCYVCRLRSPHRIALDAGPHDINFGNDAKTFARTVVDQVRTYGKKALVDNALRSFGELVAEKLPAAAFDALREVANLVAPGPPAVLIESAEPYVPWELAWMAQPLDPARPPYLGAQTLLGRWLRDSAAPSPSPATAGASTAVRIEKPPAQPPAAITVRDMAVMAGMYKAESGLRNLPAAEKEAQSLVDTYDAVPVAASAEGLRQLLDADLKRGFKPIGGPGAVHFAGHGEFEPGRTDASVLFLDDGTPLSSLLFRSAKYGGDRQPLLFLNACMIGIGGELLGDMGGFPGNCLRGGFGGVVGALWEVDDAVAAQIAIEFWSRALSTGGGDAEPVAAILRDLRAKYVVTGPGVPVATYLSYVYYGHPRLTLHRAA